MAKTKNIWLFIATIMLAVCVLGFTFSVTTPKVNAETGETWTASGNWDTATEGEYKLTPSSSLSTLTYNGTMGNKVSSVKFDFTYTTNTLAGDHWVGVCINGYWHQLYLNASHESALPYLCIYLTDGSLWASWDNSRIPREKMPHNTKNTFEIKLNENGFEFYVNDELTYNLDGYTHSNVTSLIIGSRDVEITVANPVVTLKTEAPGDKTQLNALIATVEALDESKYTVETYAAVKIALNKAKSLSAEATQTEIDAAYEALNTAYGALQLKPVDRTNLNALIATVEALDKDNYTETSYMALKTALDNAKALAENATQEEVDAAYEALNTAYGALEEKQEPDTDSSTDTDSASDSGTTDTDSGSQSEEEKTGCFGGIETTSVMLFMLGMVAVYAIIKRRKVNN